MFIRTKIRVLIRSNGINEIKYKFLLIMLSFIKSLDNSRFERKKTFNKLMCCLEWELIVQNHFWVDRILDKILNSAHRQYLTLLSFLQDLIYCFDTIFCLYNGFFPTSIQRFVYFFCQWTEAFTGVFYPYAKHASHKNPMKFISISR